MGLSNKDRVAVSRTRGSRAVVRVLLVLMWLGMLGITWFKVSVVLDVTAEHGMTSVLELLDMTLDIDESKPQLSSFEVLLVTELRAVLNRLILAMLMTISGIWVLQLAGLVDRLATEVDAADQ